MTVFPGPAQSIDELDARRMRQLFVVLFLAGVILRGYASFATLVIIHPDEHQQFLEQAHRLVYGYGEIFWEQERGLRHPFYPALLAVPLAILDELAVTDPLIQGACIRWLVSILSLTACSIFAWEFFRRGDAALAVAFLMLCTFLPDMIFWQIHPLSEIGSTVFFLLALTVMDRLPAASGILLGMAFAVRFQMGFLIGPAVIVGWAGNRFRIDRSTIFLALGLGGTLAGVGLSDRVVFGDWYHSAIGYFRVTVVENCGNQWGVDPWHRYFDWVWFQGGWGMIVPLAGLAILGLWRQWRFALLAVAFIVPHALIDHKEARFLIPVVPLMLVLIAGGFQLLYRLAGVRFRRVLVGAALAALAAIAAVRSPEIEWNANPYRASSFLFQAAGMRPDLEGIALAGADRTGCGNAFYLRRDVPRLFFAEADIDLLRQTAIKRGATINYLVCQSFDRDEFEALGLTEIESCDGWVLYRLNKPVGARP